MSSRVQKILIILFGIAINILGRNIAVRFNLPIWLDMVGTFLVSYYFSLTCGIIAGVANNIYAGIANINDLAYCITSVVAAIIIYIFKKRGYLTSLVKAVVSTFWLGIICTFVSTPINLFLYDGYSGNIWGDTLVDMLRWHNVGKLTSSLAGDAVVEIIDKQVCFVIAYIIIRIIRVLKQNKKSVVSVLAVLVAFSVWGNTEVGATNNSDTEYSLIPTVYNNSNGMFSSEANTICETSDGCIWIGSYAGLTRYDGNEFEFVKESGLVNVLSMMLDSKGRLWIGTNDAGIARYENGKYTYFNIEDGLPSNSIRSFVEDEQGNVYVATTDRICRINVDDSVEKLGQDILFAKYMEIYNGKLIVLDNKGKIHALEDDKTITFNESADSYFYYCLSLTSRGLMAGTDTGELFVLELTEDGFDTKENINIDASRVSTLFEDRQKRIWIALDTGFGYMDENDEFHKMYYKDFPASIVCFHEDYQGNIWIASSNYGVMKLSESPFCNIFEKANIEGKVVNAFVKYNNDYYCGTDDGLIILDGKAYDQKQDEFTNMTKGFRVRSLFVDKDNGIWLCTYNGLLHRTKEGVISSYTMTENQTTSNRFRCITQLDDGTVVVGTADGINYIKNQAVIRTIKATDGLENTQILSILQGYDGNVWAGSDGSGIYVISQEGIVKNYTVEDGLSSNIILRIVPYEKGYLIVTSNALCYMDESNNIKRLTSFPYFNNYDVIIQEDTAYVTGSAGLYMVNLAALCENNVDFATLYGADHGLVSGFTANSWNYVDEAGKIYLCSNNGIISFKEDMSATKQDMKFGVVLVEYDGEKAKLTNDNTYLIPKSANNISISASVRNYAYTDIKVKFYIKELEDNPVLYEWDKLKPIQLYKADFSRYNICMQIYDNSGNNLLQEQNYIVDKEINPWERDSYKIYLKVVLVEIFLFTIFSIIAMILFVIRKNELEKHKLELEKQVGEQTKELSASQGKLNDLFTRTVMALTEAVDAKDRYTSGHSKRVAEYATLIAAKMGKTKEEQEEIYRAGLLHDVGKIRVPAEIINKPGKLTDEEYNTIKIHPVTGYHILKGISRDNSIAIAARYHHERYDGNGYPNGLVGERIPQIARILAVADAYDAMASNRSYRNALPQAVVRREIERGRGTQFDPQIADIMLDLIDNDTDYNLRQLDTAVKNILTIDDEEMNNKIIEHIMKDEPMYRVISATSGLEALEILKNNNIDMILLDVRMPGMDGFETLKHIRASYSVPVVLMTSDKTLDTQGEFKEYGYSDYITKPILPILLKEIIHNMTEGYVE